VEAVRARLTRAKARECAKRTSTATV